MVYLCIWTILLSVSVSPSMVCIVSPFNLRFKIFGLAKTFEFLCHQQFCSNILVDIPLYPFAILSYLLMHTV